MDINSYNRVLTAKGYAIKKSSLTVKQQQKIRSDLTVSPAVAGRRGMAGTGKSFAIYFESPLRFYLPKVWAREKFGPEEYDAMSEGVSLPSELQFTGKPFDYQEAILQKFTDAGSNGLLCVPCGKGKTFMALCLAARLGKRFLVIVDKEFLLNQWKGEMEVFFPGLRIGILQGSRAEVDPELYDCTICMIQSLVQKTYPEETFRTYGFSIFDECHHLGASNFSQALLKIQTKWSLGLSATPTRDDGLTKVFEWYLGTPFYWEKQREADSTVLVHALRFATDIPSYTTLPVDYRGETVLARLLGQVIECMPRNAWIAEHILTLLWNEPLRRVLVLGERITQLEELEIMLQAVEPTLAIGYYIGGMKESIREAAGKEARVLLASYAMASEAMNIKSLNTVVLASPRKKIEQSVGRILRERPGDRKVSPLIVDVIDSHGVYQGQWRKRRAFYKACGYKMMFTTYKDYDESEEICCAKKDSELSGSDSEQEQDSPKAASGCLFVEDV
jgi:superfamily II DNA or RNA helicase